MDEIKPVVLENSKFEYRQEVNTNDTLWHFQPMRNLTQSTNFTF